MNNDKNLWPRLGLLFVIFMICTLLSEGLGASSYANFEYVPWAFVLGWCFKDGVGI